MDVDGYEAEGSSPLARGAHLPVEAGDVDAGIIPACAGSTGGRRAESTSTGDHPRLRGEHLSAMCVPSMRTGSSPLARGALIWHSDTGTDWRIIPACAGSTSRQTSCDAALRDHPRLRGEHCLRSRWRQPCGGSSPLARGAHFNTSNSSSFCLSLCSLFHCDERDFAPNLCALRYFEAPLQPAGKEPISVASSVPTGRLISLRPSQSTGIQSG